MANLKNKDRNPSIELLRILAMIMVIILHNLAGSGALYEQSGFMYQFYWWMEALCICAVDVFVLISAYFLINASFNLKNIFRIVAVTLAFSIPLSLLSARLSGNTHSISACIKIFFPVLTKKFWFVNAYLALYLLSPFLNRLLRGLDRKQFAVLLWIEIGMMILRPTLFPKVWAQDMTAGLSVFFFIALYCIGAWIRLYGFSWEIHPVQYGILYLAVSFSLVAVKAALMYFGISEDTASRYYSYDSLFVVLQALALFLGFLHTKPCNGRRMRIINSIAQYSFAAYIIHYSLNSVLWRQILHLDRFVGRMPTGPLVIIISSVLIFLTSCFLDFLRTRIAKVLRQYIDSTKIGSWEERQTQKWNRLFNGQQ